MASHVVVIDSSFRRTTVKVTPGKFMTEVLEEACTKLGLTASNYGLRNNNKPVDLSRTFRQTGLSSGAKLELVVSSRSPSVVSVALQLPQSMAQSVPGGRLIDKFPSDTTIWLILRKFETSGGANLNFTARGVARTENGASGAGRIYYEMPVLNIMGRELASFVDLQKTLAQLGMNGGSSLIRLDFRMTDQPLDEAMADIEKYFSSVEVNNNDTNKSAAEASVTEALTNLSPNNPEVASQDAQPATESLEATSTPTTSVTPSKPTAPEEKFSGPDQRPIDVFSAPTSQTPQAALQADDNDEDYEPTIAHAKLHQTRLQSAGQNRRLLSDAEIQAQEAERAAKLSAAKEVSIKIRFPDQSSIVSPFKAHETAADLYKYVTAVIIAEDEPFKLVWSNAGGPQQVPRSDERKLIKDLGFEGRMLINFHWEDGASAEARKAPVLKSQFSQNAKELVVPTVPTVETEEEKPAAPVNQSKGKETDGTKPKLGMPKWFKGIGKK
ncbi:GLUT4 regulating protein TUG-domain-containing protein [Xylogone sp. PMI_703]|nr:GLUT4 regulating protein TUG-domain-containing protein [Xylogone sp. PMI_703]